MRRMETAIWYRLPMRAYVVVMSPASCKNRYGVRYLLEKQSGPWRLRKEDLRHEQNTTVEEDETRD